MLQGTVPRRRLAARLPGRRGQVRYPARRRRPGRGAKPGSNAAEAARWRELASGARDRGDTRPGAHAGHPRRPTYASTSAPRVRRTGTAIPAATPTRAPRTTPSTTGSCGASCSTRSTSTAAGRARSIPASSAGWSPSCATARPGRCCCSATIRWRRWSTTCARREPAAGSSAPSCATCCSAHPCVVGWINGHTHRARHPGRPRGRRTGRVLAGHHGLAHRLAAAGPDRRAAGDRSGTCPRLHGDRQRHPGQLPRSRRTWPTRRCWPRWPASLPPTTGRSATRSWPTAARARASSLTATSSSRSTGRARPPPSRRRAGNPAELTARKSGGDHATSLPTVAGVDRRGPADGPRRGGLLSGPGRILRAAA